MKFNYKKVLITLSRLINIGLIKKLLLEISKIYLLLKCLKIGKK